MRFYTNVHVNGSTAFLRGYDNGVRFEHQQSYSPFLFLPSQILSDFRTLDGKYVKPVHFTDSKEARDFIKRYDDVGNFPVYGTTSFTYQCIYENFKGDMDYDVDLINVVSIDIETSTQYGFPNIATADKEIITLSIRKRGKCIVLGTRPYTPKSSDVKYHQCKNEVDLLTTFLRIWNSDQWKPDVVTGWNIENFDIPYLYVRITNILGIKEAKKLLLCMTSLVLLHWTILLSTRSSRTHHKSHIS
jgi:DNA polymerase family B, exonuclease domain